VVEVKQSKVAVTTAQTRRAEAQYDNKIAEVTLAYTTGGQARMEFDPTIR
jgi:outer membrane protein